MPFIIRDGVDRYYVSGYIRRVHFVYDQRLGKPGGRPWVCRQIAIVNWAKVI